jgi:hypothetical protein
MENECPKTEAENRFWKEKKTKQTALHMLKKKKFKTHTYGSCTFECRNWDTTGGKASAFLPLITKESLPLLAARRFFKTS